MKGAGFDGEMQHGGGAGTNLVVTYQGKKGGVLMVEEFDTTVECPKCKKQWSKYIGVDKCPDCHLDTQFINIKYKKGDHIFWELSIGFISGSNQREMYVCDRDMTEKQMETAYMEWAWEHIERTWRPATEDEIEDYKEEGYI
jgi:hypothetical protein